MSTTRFDCLTIGTGISVKFTWMLVPLFYFDLFIGVLVTSKLDNVRSGNCQMNEVLYCLLL